MLLRARWYLLPSGVVKMLPKNRTASDYNRDSDLHVHCLLDSTLNLFSPMLYKHVDIKHNGNNFLLL